MQNKNILLNKLLNDINNLPNSIKNILEDDALSDADKIIMIAEDIIEYLKQYLIEY